MIGEHGELRNTNLEHAEELVLRQQAGAMSSQVKAMITVAILGGDSVVGQALELLLQGAGYRTRVLTELLIDNPDGPLGGAHLLLIVPGLREELRETVLTSTKTTPDTAKVPILELVAALQSGQGGQEHRVPWPCRIEELKLRIENALLAG